MLMPPRRRHPNDSFNRAPERIAGKTTLGMVKVTQFAPGSALLRLV